MNAKPRGGRGGSDGPSTSKPTDETTTGAKQQNTVGCGTGSGSPQDPAGEVFVQLLTSHQLSLLHYIAMLLGDVNEARNVLQETNLVLWRKSSEFELGTKFSTWAHQVAYWQVQAFIRDRKRDRHVFDEQMIAQLARIEPEEWAEPEVRVALRHCLAGVSSANQEMLRMRYEGGMTINSLAAKLQKTPAAVKVGLLRVRRALLRCIERQMASE